MPNRDEDLGRLEVVHVIAPAYVQRAVFIAVLAFMFFLAMMFAFYVRQHILYFFLSSAFLILYLITMFSFVVQRRANVEVYENGFKYRKNVVLWGEITDVNEDGVIKFDDRKAKSITIPSTLRNADIVIAEIRRRGLQ